MASTTTQKPTTSHLVQLPAGISAILRTLLIAAPEVPLGPLLCTAATARRAQ
jgi:hypothetical protein